MRYDNYNPHLRQTWCPQDPKGVDHFALCQYFYETMGVEWGAWWLRELDRLAGRTQVLDVDSRNRLVQQICKYDAPELVELLYPICPELFLTPINHPFQAGELNALARCAQMGSVACLETLLELGADPNGLDNVTGRNQLSLRARATLLESDASLATLQWQRLENFPKGLNPLSGLCCGGAIPVTPLDCARLEGQEDCCLLLEQYGGVTVRELCGLSWEEMPPEYQVLMRGWQDEDSAPQENDAARKI